MMTLKEKLDQAVASYKEGLEAMEKMTEVLLQQKGAILTFQALIAEEEKDEQVVAPVEGETNNG